MAGYKTYVTAALIIALAVAKGLGYVPQDLYETLLGLLLGTGMAALRAGVKKAEG